MKKARTSTRNISWEEANKEAERIAKGLITHTNPCKLRTFRLYGIPRGGIIPAVMVQSNVSILLNQIGLEKGHKIELVEVAEQASHLIDDIIDTEATRLYYQKRFPATPFLALFRKRKGSSWFSFPWERMVKEEGPEDNVRRILEYIGEDLTREGLRETPERVVRSWEKIYGGYKTDPFKVLKTFSDVTCDEMIILKGCEFFSTCEHHLLPFVGKAHIGYIPDGKVVGISKLARLLEVFARRAQIQERIGEQITKALMGHLKPKGCGVVLEAQHLCMTSRGVEKQNSIMITSSMKGCFLEGAVKQEFLKVIGK